MGLKLEIPANEQDEDWIEQSISSACCYTIFTVYSFIQFDNSLNLPANISLTYPIDVKPLFRMAPPLHKEEIQSVNIGL